ncbi:kelch-like protein 10 [Megalops cyprinoides]|uniref:kelch-like protein 10 n=1 Tax=Megalops cyprinoides TaxID=118141 RepID=UPI001864A5D1|nr:kelch-like protein 10 [Megalops cyprinoides]
MDYTIFNKLRLEDKLCDVVITVNGTKFKAHKAILCACSSYFCNMFTSDSDSTERQEYNVTGVSPYIMKLIIEHLYTCSLMVTEDNVLHLLQAASQLCILGIVQACSDFLEAWLCPQNCIGIWNITETYLCPKLRDRAYRFVLHNFEEIVRTSKEFVELSLTQLSDIIESDELNVREDVVFELILQWIAHLPVERKPYISTLLPKVRMALMDPDYFSRNVVDNSLLKDNSECSHLVTHAGKVLSNRLMNRSSSNRLTRPRLPCTILLAIGGWSGSCPSNVMESYDMRANGWVKVLQEEGPRAYHGAAYLKGFVYCLGGRNNIEFFSSVRKFDPAALTWHEAAPMHCCRCFVSVTELDGQIYAMGGFDGHVSHSSAERYKPETNQWSFIAPMHEHRSDASATTLYGKVYIFGGFNGEDCLSSAECYTPQTNQWTMITPMSSRRSGLGAIAYGEEVYAVGGFDGVSRLQSGEAYDPQTSSWRPVPDMVSTRSNFGIGVLDDRLFVVGGLNIFTSTDGVECYDKKTSEWTKVKSMESPRGALSCCVVAGLPNITQYASTRDSL